MSRFLRGSRKPGSDGLDEMDVNDLRDVHITSRSFWEQKMRLRCVMTHDACWR